MKIGFILDRKNYVEYYRSIVEYLPHKDLVFLAYENLDNKSNKAYQNIDRDYINFLKKMNITIKVFRNFNELNSILRYYFFDFIFSLHLPDRYGARKYIHFNNWCIIHHTFDSFHDPLIFSKNTPHPDYFFAWGENWIQSFNKYCFDKLNILSPSQVFNKKNTFYVGSTKLDNFSQSFVQRANKRIVFFPPEYLYSKFYYSSINQLFNYTRIKNILIYKRLSKLTSLLMRNLHRQLGKEIIIKARKKSFDLKHWQPLGNIELDNFHSLQSPILKLFTKNALSISFESTVSMESLALNLKTINMNYFSNLVNPRSSLSSSIFKDFLDSAASSSLFLNFENIQNIEVMTEMINDWFYDNDRYNDKIVGWIKPSDSSAKEILNILGI